MTTETKAETNVLTYVEVHVPEHDEPLPFMFDDNYALLTDDSPRSMARRFHERSGRRAVAIRRTTVITTTVETVVLYDSAEEVQS